MAIDDLFIDYLITTSEVRNAGFGIESDSRETITGQAEIVPKKKRVRRAKREANVETLFGQDTITAFSGGAGVDTAQANSTPVQTPIQQTDASGEAGISEECKNALAVLDSALAKLRDTRNALWWENPEDKTFTNESRLLWAAVTYLAGLHSGSKP